MSLKFTNLRLKSNQIPQGPLLVLCEGIPLVTGGFFSLRASKEKMCFMSWPHDSKGLPCQFYLMVSLTWEFPNIQIESFMPLRLNNGIVEMHIQKQWKFIPKDEIMSESDTWLNCRYATSVLLLRMVVWLCVCCLWKLYTLFCFVSSLLIQFILSVNPSMGSCRKMTGM